MIEMLWILFWGAFIIFIKTLLYDNVVISYILRGKMGQQLIGAI